jgi:hypothetical protein
MLCCMDDDEDEDSTKGNQPLTLQLNMWRVIWSWYHNKGEAAPDKHPNEHLANIDLSVSYLTFFENFK